MAHPLTSHTPLSCGFAKGLPAEMVGARAGPWKTHRKPHARAALRRAGEGTEHQGSTTGLPTGTGSMASQSHGRRPGRRDAGSARPRGADVTWRPVTRATSLPDRLDKSRLVDAPVAGDQRQAEGHGRGGDEAVPRVTERVA